MPKPTQKVLFFDIETTGPSPKKHSIWSMSGILAEIIPDDSVQTIEQFTFTAAPPRGEDLVPSYTSNDRITQPELKALEELNIVHNQKLVPFLNKHVNIYNAKDSLIIIGYNANLDISFLRWWFRKMNDRQFGNFFRHQPLDIITLFVDRMAENRLSLPNLKLETLAAQGLLLPVSITLLGSSEYNCRLVLEIYAALKELEINEEPHND